MVAVGCPGGRMGKTDISTIRKPLTPITLALESTTAIVSLANPILPEQEASVVFFCQTWAIYLDLQVEDA